MIYDNSSINKEGADNLKDSNCKSEKEIRAYWKQINDSKLIAKSAGQKVYPGSFDRNLGEITEPEIDWKIKLWNFLVKTPTDYGIDRRLISSGLYLENLEGESIDVFCCIDTSDHL